MNDFTKAFRNFKNEIVMFFRIDVLCDLLVRFWPNKQRRELMGEKQDLEVTGSQVVDGQVIRPPTLIPNTKNNKRLIKKLQTIKETHFMELRDIIFKSTWSAFAQEGNREISFKIEAKGELRDEIRTWLEKHDKSIIDEFLAFCYKGNPPELISEFAEDFHESRNDKP